MQNETDKTLLVFTRLPGWRNRIVSLRYGWSSMDIIIPQKEGQPVFVLGLDAQSGKVTEMPLANRLVPASQIGLLTFSHISPMPIINIVKEQMGIAFDWHKLLPKFLQPKNPQQHTWFPSDLFYWAFKTAGYQLGNPKDDTLSMRDFWSLTTCSSYPITREIIKK